MGNGGSTAQVITPGASKTWPKAALQGDSPFELAYVGWLCERKSSILTNDNGVDQCAVVDLNTNLCNTEDGHYKILTDPRYKQIGCGFAARDPTKGMPVTFEGGISKRQRRPGGGQPARTSQQVDPACLARLQSGNSDRTSYFQGFWACDLS